MNPLIPAMGAAAVLATSAFGQHAPRADSLRFVVLGHIRGDGKGLSPRLPEVIAKVRTLRPAFVVLTGDVIWGDFDSKMADPVKVEREWIEVDSALSSLDVPIYRVPGNHDINDVPSRDAWIRRYGPLPAKVVVGDTRLLFLSSAWIPADGDTLHGAYTRGVDLDSSQVGWLAKELATPTRFGHTFAFMHHLLWWEPADGRWWREVHPRLAAAGVDAVFSGDYGPLKFSNLERDGVRYFQSSIELPVSLPILRNRISSRVLSAQFDSFLEVLVVGPGADVRVQTVAEVSSGEFTPDRYRAINDPAPQPTEPLLTRVWNEVGTPKRLAALGAAIVALFCAGYLVGRRRARL